jgi:hypothetical protein
MTSVDMLAFLVLLLVGIVEVLILRLAGRRP